MPYYEYHCKNKHAEDHLVSYSEREEPQVCSDCGEPSYYKTVFCTNFQYGKDYSSYAADTKRWNQRENKRMNTKGQSYA